MMSSIITTLIGVAAIAAALFFAFATGVEAEKCSGSVNERGAQFTVVCFALTAIGILLLLVR